MQGLDSNSTLRNKRGRAHGNRRPRLVDDGDTVADTLQSGMEPVAIVTSAARASKACQFAAQVDGGKAYGDNG